MHSLAIFLVSCSLLLHVCIAQFTVTVTLTTYETTSYTRPVFVTTSTAESNTVTVTPLTTLTQTTDVTITSVQTATASLTATATLTASTSTVTNTKCQFYSLTFASQCCPTSSLHTRQANANNRQNRRWNTSVQQISQYSDGQPVPSTVTVTTTSTAYDTGIVFSTSSTTITGAAVLTTSTLPTSTVTGSSTTETITTVIPTTTSVTATVTQTQAPVTVTTCASVHVPKFACPRFAQSRYLKQAELAYLDFYKARAPPSFPSIVVQCDGNNALYFY